MDIKDFLIEVRQGNIPGYSIEHKFGRNDNIQNGIWGLVSPIGGSGVFRTSAIQMRVKSGGSVDDTVDGDGARGITVIGIDSSLTEISETIVTSGAGVSLPTTARFWRVYRSYVADGAVGTYGGSNVGNIIIEDSGGADNIIQISEDEGQSQHGAYSIPAGRTGYLLTVHLTTDASKAADFRLFTREDFTNVLSSMSPKRLRLYWDGILGHVDAYIPHSPGISLPALTDVWIEAEGGGANTEVSVDFEILLVDNPVSHIKRI
jgi:hypothetical protein